MTQQSIPAGLPYHLTERQGAVGLAQGYYVGMIGGHPPSGQGLFAQ